MSAAQDSFVHLHVHSEYSMLDGAARIPDLLDGCEQMNMPALALTDHGFLFGAHEFYAKAQQTPVKPIIGLESYLTPKTHRTERKRVRWGDGGSDDVSGGGAYTHMTLWAENTTGMHNLFRLGTRAATEGFFYKPRIDRELLGEYGAGLIGSTGCPSGEVQTYLRLGDYRQALASASEFSDIFGAGNFYVELMDHGLSLERRVREGLLSIAKDLNLPLVATNDLHYARHEDASAHEVLLCVQSGATMADTGRFKLEGDGYYLKSPAEMRRIFAELPQACDNTLEIAERCQVEFAEGEGRFMPRFDCPAGEDETSWFLKEVERGLAMRFPDGISDQIRQRADFESQVIIGKGYPGYFLVVADFMQWAKNRGIRTGVRGSGAGSLCAYALRITDLDPLEYRLTFERFLNPERKSMPDFDVDFDERRRGEVIRYVTDKYGDDRVAQIVTYGTIKAKQSVKDASRVLGYPFAMGEKITKAMPPPVMGKDIGLEQMFDQDHPRYAEGGEFRQLYDGDNDTKKVVDTAMGLEGLKRQWGVHAAGVIMSSDPLIDIIPLLRREQDGAIITQFDYPTCETLGLVKMDFLGLRNLTILGDAVSNVQLNRDVNLDLDVLGADPTDASAYELLSSGDTLGVFQLDGGGTRSLLRQMKPQRIQDIMATIALYRPGPMGINSHTNYAMRRSGQQQISYPHPEVVDALSPVIADNYGLIVYQEDVIEVARQLAGYSLGRADMLRRAMGKKKKEVLDAEYEPFATGMKENGFSDEAVRAVWDALMPFADYGFGKAHAAAYAQVSYWTAYLKANYGCEYMAAVLQSVADDKDKIAIYLAECRRMGIKVLPPDVNESEARFTPVGNDIRFGLTAIRNVGQNVVDGVVAARREAGKAGDFFGFLDQIPLVACNKRVIESLIKAGAFDSMGHTRRGLMSIFEQAVDGVIDLKRNEAHGQDDLFGDLGQSDLAGQAGVVPELAEWDKRTRLGFEREMLGLYVSDHPLQGLEHVLESERDITIGNLIADDGPREGVVTIAGMITSVVRKTTKRGDIWAVITVEDLEASAEVLMFPKAYDLASTVLSEDTVVRVKGRLKHDTDDGSLSLICSELTVPDIRTGPDMPLVISVPKARCTPPVVDELESVLQAHRGMTEVQLRLTDVESSVLMRLRELRVEPSQPLMADLKALLGPACLAS